MNEYGELTAPGEVRMTRLLPGTVERLWQYLVDSDKRGTWLARGEIQPHVNGGVDLEFQHQELSGEAAPEGYASGCDGGSIVGRVTRYEPPHVLGYTWDGHGGEFSEVIFELAERDRQVLLTLTHRRRPNREEAVCVASGWHTHLGILEDVLNSRHPRPFWTTHMAVEASYRREFADFALA